MITAHAVSKQFGPVTAVDQVSFALERNQIIGLVGANGAGKSTLLKMLATVLYPSAGRITVDGIDATERPLDVRRRIGYLAGDTPLYREMRADRFLDFVARAHGYRGVQLIERVGWVVEACGVREAMSKRIKECSTGFRKRIGLAAALVHDPRVVLLDEPTHGLDPFQVVTLRELLQQLKSSRTILLSSHIITEVAHIADRILILHAGKILADGTLEELCSRHGRSQGDLEGLFLGLVRDYTSRSQGEPRHAG